MSFANLKKNAEELNKKVAEQLSQDGQREYKEDNRLWYPQRDKAGNGSAVIRFLPSSPLCDVPFVKLYSHSFKEPSTGQWYIENSLSTFGEPDPVGEDNQRLWNTDLEANKNIARRRKRQVNYYFNVYIIKDSQNPENDGTVKIMRAGPMWYNFIKSKLVPEFDDIQPVPVFDLWKGATFRVRIKTEKMLIDGKEVLMPNYDNSTWDSPAPLFDDDDKLEEIWNQGYDLNEFIDRKNFKSYEDLKKRFDKVIGRTSQSYSTSEYKEDEPPFKTEKKIEEPKFAKTVEDSVVVDEDDDDLKFFAKLAAED